MVSAKAFVKAELSLCPILRLCIFSLPQVLISRVLPHKPPACLPISDYTQQDSEGVGSKQATALWIRKCLLGALSWNIGDGANML